MAINRTVPVHSSDKFTWYNKLGCAEVSDFNGILADVVYDDAIDVGFFVTSRNTGVKKLFTLTRTVETAENGVECWRFESNDGIAIDVFNT